MQISKQRENYHQAGSAIALFLTLLVASIITTWFSQNSIKAYWQQTYHTVSPITQFDRFRWWRAGGTLQAQVNESYQQFLGALTAVNDTWQAHWAHSTVNLNTPTHERADHSVLPTEQRTVAHSSVVESVGKQVATTSQAESVEKITTEVNAEPESQLDRVPPQEAVDRILQEEPQLVLQSTAAVQQSQSKLQHQSTHQDTLRQDKHPNDARAQTTAVLTPPSSTEITNQAVTPTAEPAISSSTPKIKRKPIKRIIMPTRKRLPDAFEIHSGDTVFFAGDSLMQGVAPHVQKWLKAEHGIASINLSKQSTGLAYPNFFDWPAVIEQQLRSDHSIKLLVVFLGPNDPWDIPNPDNPGGKYLKFRSPEWATVYNQRIKRILDAAEAADVHVIWLGVPRMKKRALDEQMTYINELLSKTLRGKALWLPTDDLLSDNQPNYHDSIDIAGKNTRVRSKDGIHFTVSGQKYLAEYVKRHIRFKP